VTVQVAEALDQFHRGKLLRHAGIACVLRGENLLEGIGTDRLERLLLR
jgi:hypothetical protein